MRRVVSVWFPHWPTDRLQRRRGPGASPAAPLVTALHDGRKRVIAAVSPAASALGLRPGLAVAQALALVPGLDVAEAEPEADAEALRRLALWCHALTPLAAASPPDGLWLDVTGCVHGQGGEAAMLQRLVARLGRDGLQARTAVADTPGCAHALARHGGSCTVVPPAAQAEALAGMPVGALRISPELDATLRRLGFDQVAHLVRIPSALLARRFGPLLGMRLDQAHGKVQEPIEPLPPEHQLQHRLCFLEPLSTAEAFQAVVPRLAGPVCREMERLGLGARQVDLVFERLDGHAAAIRIGTARPSRDAAHLSRMLLERLETIDPGPGVEAIWLAASVTQRLDWEQQGEGVAAQDAARLVDRLANRLGAASVYRTAPVASDIPERMTLAVGPAALMAELEAGRVAPAGQGGMRDQAQEWPPAERGVLRRARRNHLRLVMQAPAGPGARAAEMRREGAALQVVGTGPAAPARPAPQPWRASPAVAHRSRMRVAGALDDEAAEVPREGGVGPRMGDPLDRDPPLLPWLPKPDAEPGASAGDERPWPNRLQAPSRLLSPPRAIKAIAALPDGPPAAFTWRRRHLVRRADGPERVFGEWWRSDPETDAVRDYFIVEDENGQRFWLFRRGNGIDPGTGNLEWFFHGLF